MEPALATAFGSLWGTVHLVRAMVNRGLVSPNEVDPPHSVQTAGVVRDSRRALPRSTEQFSGSASFEQSAAPVGKRHRQYKSSGEVSVDLSQHGGTLSAITVLFGHA